MALAITNENYESLMASGQPVVIDFWAEWCGPCRMIGPIIEELAAEYEGKVDIGKCHVDSADDIVAQYRVRNIPTVVFIKNGEVVDKVVGATSKETLKAKVDALLKEMIHQNKQPRLSKESRLFTFILLPYYFFLFINFFASQRRTGSS